MSSRVISIEVMNLSKLLGGRPVLDGEDVVIESGQCVALTGANGCGKTTLLRCLAASIRPTSGEVRWFGSAVVDADLKHRIGFVSHESRLYPHLTIYENLVFAGRMCSLGNPQSSTQRWLDACGLAACADRFPRQLSRGMCQRVAIARALIHDPQIALLDEPFGGLDANGGKWLDALLRDLIARGKTIVFSSHEQLSVESLATHVLVLKDGRVSEVISGPMECHRQTVRRAA